jgi:hypothetical protein
MPRILILFLLIVFSFNSFAQCSVCGTTYSSNTAIVATANNQVFCINGGTSYSFSSNYSNVTLKVCASNITITNFESRSSGLNTRLEIRAPNLTISNIQVDADTTKIVSYSSGAKISSQTVNKKLWLETKNSCALTVEQNLNPGDKIFVNIGPNSSFTAASLTSNQGGYVNIGRGATYKSTGELSLQNNGYIYNEGTLDLADLKVQGGANALMNICGESLIKVSGTMTFNSGSTHNEGTITMNKMWVNSGPYVFPKKGSTITVTSSLDAMNQTNFFRGDTLTAGQCSIFKISSIGSWNNNLANSSRIYYCGPAATKLGFATASCTCNSTASVCGAILPLNIINLTATYLSGTVKLNWKISESYKNSYFIIEKTNGENTFETVGKTSSPDSDFMCSFDDRNVSEGTNYYRVRQYTDENRLTGEILTSINVPAHNISIYPNPSDGRNIHVSGLHNDLSILTIYSPVGEIISEINLTENHTELPDISGLQKGIYIIKYLNGKEISYERLYIY